MFTGDNATTEAVLLVADAIGDVIEFWGFRKALGRIWAVLYLADEPIAADVLGQTLQMSTGAVSMALNELQRWGVVRRVWRPGHRKEFFEAETDFWKMISKVVSERERFLARSVRERLEEAGQRLKSAPQTAHTRARRERVRSLLSFVNIAEAMIDAFVVSQKADFSRFGDVLQLVRRSPKTTTKGSR